ncbi:hypothetical protein P3X46_031282 [Hevea brasiliensis]|uniref:Uncharacterized protein n=1 Tax=Hevea brasiliensis TaxID=3981 RepID=A0ABQ9KJU1_HEVBR|nr:hypothetical protein P3X46_031282 [Hevea brasiliensis]
MASFKAEKPAAGSQTTIPVKKEPAKCTSCAPKAPATQPAPKKAEQKPQEPKKKLTGSKPATK